MAVAYGVLFPCGIGIARNLKSLGPLWFKLHVSCQLLGYALGAVGFALGWVVGGTNSEYQLHM